MAQIEGLVEGRADGSARQHRHRHGGQWSHKCIADGDKLASSIANHMIFRQAGRRFLAEAEALRGGNGDGGGGSAIVGGDGVGGGGSAIVGGERHGSAIIDAFMVA